MFKNLPPPEPFSWKKLLKQCAVQLIVMAGAVLYMKFYMQPKLEADLAKQMKILEQQRLAEFRANQTDFSAVGDGELEVELPCTLLSARKMPLRSFTTLWPRIRHS